MTVNLINKKIYIGKDSKNNPKYLGSGLLIKRAIKKYGKENFKKEILEYCETTEKLNEKEIYWIEKLNAIQGGYNIMKGGEGGDNFTNHPNKEKRRLHLKNRKLTEEWKIKIGNSNRGVARNNKHLYTKEVREKIVKTRLKNKKTWTLSKASKEKISNALKGKKKPPRTKEHLEKLAKSNREIDKSIKIRGKTYEEIYGIKRAKELKKLKSKKWKNEQGYIKGKKLFNKNGKVKYINIKEIEEYIINGWKKGGIKHA